jgi:probable HAF family extracellular repeat protein
MRAQLSSASDRLVAGNSGCILPKMHLGTETLFGRKGEDMSAVRRLRNFWIPWVTIVLACFSEAAAQASYKVTDLGTLGNDNQGCAMSVNNQGWTEFMAGNVGGPGPNSVVGILLNGRAVLGVDGFKIDLGTLGGPNSWMNWGQINDRAQIVGYSETNVSDPDGEDVCGFGTGLTCRPFLWQNNHMSALPTLGGNNGEASAINNRGQIAGFAETTVPDAGCPPYKTTSAVLWEKGKAQALPAVGSDPDGVAYAINDEGQAVGYSGTCTAAIHAVLWESGTAFPLPDLGIPKSNIAWGINDQGQIVGQVRSPDGTTRYAALWQNGVLTNLGVLPGDLAAIATGINNKGQVVGSTWDSNFNWAHGFIWQDGVMTDLNTLFPANTNLFATMANKINERGQISGMAVVLSGPDAGNVHAFLATPVNGSIGKSVADAARTLPKITLPAKVGNQLLRRSGVGRFER